MRILYCQVCRLRLYHTHYSSQFYQSSLHDALPIWFHATQKTAFLKNRPCSNANSTRTKTSSSVGQSRKTRCSKHGFRADRKSTRLNSSHLVISYAVFCLKNKKAV